MMTNESALAAAHLYAKREELLNHVLGIVRGDGVILVAPVEGALSKLSSGEKSNVGSAARH